jgi:sugar phosphate isomerase/epimerase
MNIEEPDVPASIQSAGEWIQLVHLGDSNRMLPGQGHIDFASGFAALKEIAYNGFVVLECGILGDPEIQLPRSVQFVKGHL